MTETICASSKIRMMCIHKSHIHEFQRSIGMYSQPQLRLPLGRYAQIPYRPHLVARPAENPVTHAPHRWRALHWQPFEVSHLT